MTRKTKKRIKRIAVPLGIVSAFWLGFGIGINEMADTGSGGAVREAYNDTAEIAESTKKSEGERGTEIYTVEIWTDGMAKVTTNQGYINQLSDNTLLITDKSYDEVTKEMIIAEDLQEVDE